MILLTELFFDTGIMRDVTQRGGEHSIKLECVKGLSSLPCFELVTFRLYTHSLYHLNILRVELLMGFNPEQ